MILLLDCGVGNLHSVQKALQTVGGKITLTDDPSLIHSASKVILPGVGAFGNFIAGLRARNFEQPLRNFTASGRPLLGICAGMQALFDVSEEMGEQVGLRLIAGRVLRFPEIAPLKVPHTGWNQFLPVNSSPLLRGFESGAYAYFNHSYYCLPADNNLSAAFTDYGFQFTSVVQKDNLFGVQFHPEKSQRVGLKILKNFLDL